LRSPLNTSTTCKLSILNTSVMYTHSRSPLRWCTLHSQSPLVFFGNRRYPVLSSVISRNRQYLCIVFFYN
jgi:hypothetical protein